MPEPRIRNGRVIPPVDPRESDYWWSGEYQSDPRYLAHLTEQAAQASQPA